MRNVTMKKKDSEKRRHVVAWVNKAEWDQVLEYIYSKDSALQRYALHRVSAWKARYASSTPVAVDCTADLVRCQVLDRSGQLSAEDLVLLYGAALVRFVNLITERQQGKVARPLRRLAGNLNIPEWVVDLRHDFTHRKLPTLKWCRKGCKVVLDWLQQEYWSRQMGGGPDEDWESQSDGEDEERVLKQQDQVMAQHKEMEAYKNARELLIYYEKEQFEVFNRLPEDKAKSAWPAPFADISWLLGEIKQFDLDNRTLLIEVLLEDGFLVPTLEQLQTLGCDPCDGITPAEPRLPQIFLRFWLPLLKMLNSISFIHLLLEKLFAELKLFMEHNNSHRAFYLSAWISEVFFCNNNKFDYHFETKVQKKTRMKDKIFVNRIQLRWQQLLSACLDAPCVSTPHLLQLILDDMEHPLPLETRERLLQLCSIYTQSKHSHSGGYSSEQKQRSIYTLESLHEKLQHTRRPGQSELEKNESFQECKWADVRAERDKELRGSPWQVCNDKVLWKNYPLGKVPRQSNEPSCLMLENYSAMTVFDQPVELESNTSQSGLEVFNGVRTAEGVFWNLGEIAKLKSGLQLF